MLNKIAEFVHTQGHCVLATCAGEAGAFAPHTSLMTFCAAPDCGEFWLATQKNTKKFRNLAENPRASLLIDDRATHAAPRQALTVAVHAAPFPSTAAEQAARAALLARSPGLSGFLADADVLVLRLVAESFQLLTGLTEIFSLEISTPVEKVLDARPRKA
ncbi:MAG TPA: pyridoxamine 5'-phosphate oxidase family protein [Humidesulfovibrio sp.]|uniref:pyridoxamine 5'-phosphate oxidase family protein n=1 Tax=Humidesulfovibrio sp. TaxID=2910988 RepID=UPI002CD01362|nr:pyridoxamine 5'-phosphate oxidase family protein [Humidesulfovibrio sp.]HWR04093.1 pyridoxamine 5'-phosphate oxidase family protein [Humidesulfovibrio sp.]